MAQPAVSSQLRDAIKRLDEHLQKVAADPSVKLDTFAFADVEYLLGSAETRHAITPELLPQLLGSLPTLQQDPQPVTRLVLSLLKDEAFETILQYIPADAFIAALHSPAEVVNDVALTLLLKAPKSMENTKKVIGAKHLILAVVRCWLYTNTIGTAEKASQLLEELLAAGGSNASDRDAIWQRLVLDDDVYNLIFSYCSLKTPTVGNDTLDEKETSVAQLRLLQALPAWAAINFTALSTSQHATVEKHHGCTAGKASLLDFAASHMVAKNDFGMQIYFINFCGDLLRKVDGRYFGKDDAPSKYPFTEALEFLVDRGVHKRCVELMLDPTSLPDDDLAQRVLPQESLNYFAVYADVHPDHFLRAAAYKADGLFADQILEFCQKTQENFAVPHLIAPGVSQFLMSVPKIVLLPRLKADGSLSATPAQTVLLKALDIKGPYPAEKLATIVALTCEPLYTQFAHKTSRGWSRDKKDGNPRRQYVKGLEAAAARGVLAILQKMQPLLFQELSHHAQNTAFLAEAQYALTFFASLFRTEWDALPPSPEVIPVEDSSLPHRIALPTETQLQVYLRDQRAIPLTGTALALKAPASSHTLAAVLSPPKPVPSVLAQGKEYSGMVEARRNALLGLSEIFAKKSTDDLEDLGIRNIDSIKQALRAQLSGRGGTMQNRQIKPEVATMGR